MRRRSLWSIGPLAFALAAWAPASESAPESARRYSDDEPLGTILNKIAHEIEEHPEDYLERCERVWLMLEAGMTGATLDSDIDTLLTKPAWRTTALRQRSWQFRLEGRYDEAVAHIHGNFEADVFGPEQYRLLADIALLRADTAAALRAHEEGWKRHGMEDDFMSLVRLSGRGGTVPDSLLAAGLRAHPASPGVSATVFEAHFRNAENAPSKKLRQASLQKALAVSEKGQGTLWPRSADWKIRHARAQIAARLSDRAQATLLGALALLEEGAKRGVGVTEDVRMRHEIFSLLDSVRVR